MPPAMTPRYLIRARRTPPPAVIDWISFLAERPVPATHLAAISASLGGDFGALLTIEAERAAARLTTMDARQRAHAWIATRSAIHRAEMNAGQARPVLGVLHRLDPVLLWPSEDYEIVTRRSLRDWRFVCRLVGRLIAVPSTHMEAVALSRGDLSCRLAMRTRLALAPAMRASIERSETLWGLSEFNDPDLRPPQETHRKELLETIDRLWCAAEIERLTTISTQKRGHHYG